MMQIFCYIINNPDIFLAIGGLVWFGFHFRLSTCLVLDYKVMMILVAINSPYKLIHSSVLAIFQILTMVTVMTERVGCPSLEVHGLSDVQKCIFSWRGPRVLAVQTAQWVCRGGEHRARPKALRRQEGVTCFWVTLIIQPTFLHKWFCRSEGLETLSRKLCSNRSSSKAYLPNNIYGLAGKSQQPKMSCFLRSGREYALNFKGGWNQMDGSCCAKKKKKWGGWE